MSLFLIKEQIGNKFYSIDFSSISGAPITLAEAKTHLNITFSDDDAYLTALIDQSIDTTERFCCISIRSKTVTLTADIIEEFELPYGPVTAFTSLSLRDNGTYTAVNAANYSIDKDTAFARYVPGTCGRLKMVYTVGYATIPLSLKLAVLNEIAFRYENRGDGTNKYANEKIGISQGAIELANGYRRDIQWL